MTDSEGHDVKKMFYIMTVVVVMGYIHFSTLSDNTLQMGVLHCIYLYHNKVGAQYDKSSGV